MTAPKILIIDDDESVRLLVASALNKGYLISMAADGAAGLAQIRSTRPDAVLCDIVMPGIDGFEVLRRVRADAANAALPFILLTSAGDRDNLRRARRSGANDVLSKPVKRVLR
jgi:CheY-like chemotaxis protein